MSHLGQFFGLKQVYRVITSKNKMIWLLYYFVIMSSSACDFSPYENMPFSVEKYVAFDSIIASYGDYKTGKHPEYLLEDCYLITGYADTITVDRKIDSFLLSIIDPNYINMRTYRLYIFKKAMRCTNNFTRRNREYSENFNYEKYLFSSYTYTYYPDKNYEILSIFKTSSDGKEYGLIWNATNTEKDSAYLKSLQIEHIPAKKRRPGLEAWFENSIGNKKQILEINGRKIKNDAKRYILRNYL